MFHVAAVTAEEEASVRLLTDYDTAIEFHGFSLFKKLLRRIIMELIGEHIDDVIGHFSLPSRARQLRLLCTVIAKLQYLGVVLQRIPAQFCCLSASPARWAFMAPILLSQNPRAKYRTLALSERRFWSKFGPERANLGQKSEAMMDSNGL
jgi:hypothetical protein